MAKLKHNLIPTEENDFHPRFFHAEILAIFLVLAILIQVFVYGGIGSRIIASFPSLANLAAVLPAILAAETNEYRVENQVIPLRQNDLLFQAATAKANDMVARSYFSHIDPDGQKPWKWITQSGYQYTYAGENLAIDFIDSKDVADAWIKSLTHRANLVNKNFTEFGIGVANGVFEDKPTTFVVQFFATPAEASSRIAKNVIKDVPKSTSSTSIATLTKTFATTSNTFIATSSVFVTTSTSSGQVLGIETSEVKNDGSTGMYASQDEGQIVLGTLIYSSKRVSATIIETLIILFVTILLFSITYSFAHHPANHPKDKFIHAIKAHWKTIVYSFVFIIILVAILILFGTYFVIPVKI